MQPRPFAHTNPLINRLPVEVLERIFVHTNVRFSEGLSCTDIVTGGVRGRLPVISLACRHWRDVVLNASELWQQIDVDRSIAWLELALSRSRNRPIDVYFHRGTAARKGIKLLVDAGHTLRLRKLVLHCDGWKTGLPLAVANQVCGLDLPALEELGLDFFDIRDDRELNSEGWKIHLQAARLPRLHTLRFYSAYIPWDSDLFAQLRVLHLEGVDSENPYMLPLDAFLATLERCQQLEDLKLAFSFPVNFPNGAPDPTRPGSDRLLSLPKLRSVHFEWDNIWRDPPEILQMFQHMRLSPDVSVTVVLEAQDARSRMAVEKPLLHVIPNDPSLFPLLRTVTKLYLLSGPLAGEQSTYIASTEQDVSVEITLAAVQIIQWGTTWEYDVDDQLPDFCTVFKAAPLRDLIIDTEQFTSVGLARAFRISRGLETIEVRYKNLEAVDQLLIALASLDTVTPPRETPVLPRLRRLWLKTLPWDPVLLPNIEKVLEWRSKRGTELQELRIEVFGRPLDEDGESDLDMEHTTQIVALRMQVDGSVDYVDVPAPTPIPRIEHTAPIDDDACM